MPRLRVIPSFGSDSVSSNQLVRTRLHGDSSGITGEPFDSSTWSTVGEPTNGSRFMTASILRPRPNPARNLGRARPKSCRCSGAVFLAVGVLGFVPGITTHYDQLTFAGHHSDAALLGIFNVSVLHNLVHLAFGVAGIALARKPILIWAARS
jgi:hypothetical protein